MGIIEIALIGSPVFTLLGLLFFYKYKKRKPEIIENFSLLFVGLSSAIFLIIAQKFELKIPFSIPEGMGVIVLFLCAVNLIRLYQLKMNLLFVLIAMPFVCYFTFPWWNRGVEGWLLFITMSFLCLLYSGLMEKIATSTRGVGHWLSLISVCVSSPLILLSHASLSHILVALSIFLPIVCLRLFFYKEKGTNFTFLYLNAALAILIINAHIRYVPSPDSAMMELVLLKSSVLLWLLAPCIAVVAKKISIKEPMIILICVQMLAVVIGLSGYFYEDKAAAEEAQYDYNNY